MTGPTGVAADGAAVAVGCDSTGAVSASNRDLVAVDLCGLPAATASLSLAANSLAALDLTPLAAASQLTALILNGNALTSLDLSPLAHAPRLERLWLHNNALTTLDLAPLAACTVLRSLYLDANKLDAAPLDLRPLAAASRHLRALRLGRNRLAGELDITPILQCSALSTLDTCASVKLTARTGGAVPAPLPPALRRRAATVHWTTAVESDSGDSDSDASSDSVPPPPTLPPHRQDGPEPPPRALQESVSLTELAALCSAPLPAGTHVAVMVGFRRAARFAAEALLREHARLAPAAVASPAACDAAALAAAGALDSAAVFLVRPDAAALVAALRAADPALPVVVVGAAADKDGPAVAAGATCFLVEPLGQRDAFAIRALAHQHARSRRARSLSSSLSLTASPLTSSSSPWSSSSPVELSVSSPVGAHPRVHQPMEVPAASPPALPSSTPRAGAAAVPLPSASSASSTSTTARSSTVTVQRSRAPPPPLRTPRRSSLERPRGPGGPRKIDFARLRERTAGISSGRSSRIEDSAIGMLFSRCGGRAFPADFSAIATLCGLPVCTSSSLHTAAKAWSSMTSGDKPTAPALSPISIMAFSSGADEAPGAGGGDGCELPAATGGGGGGGKCSVGDMLDLSEEHARQADGVSYEAFRDFWAAHLRHRDAETRLYSVLRIAHRSEGCVPVAAVRDLAAALVSNRSCDMDPAEMRALAAAVLCYEIKGLSWNWIRRQEMGRARLAAALLAAEAGMYNGVAAHLRADRLSDIRMAFAASSGKRVGCSPTLPVKDVVWLNRERGLLSQRAVEAIFARDDLARAGGMDLAHFAPMWLAINNPATRPATEYLFGVLDADADGYLTSVDVAHFYAEKRNALREDGFIATAFEHIWRGLLDSVAVGKGNARGVSLTDVRQLCSRDATTLVQSLLFLDDGEMAMVDLRTTSIDGSSAAMRAVAVC